MLQCHFFLHIFFFRHPICKTAFNLFVPHFNKPFPIFTTIYMSNHVNIFEYQFYRDSKLTRLLREAMGSLTCRTVMIAHVSAAIYSYSETMGTIQLASRIHRMRKKKSKVSYLETLGSNITKPKNLLADQKSL